eukprot:4380840-Pyramimonas_sp.AAC.1
MCVCVLDRAPVAFAVVRPAGWKCLLLPRDSAVLCSSYVRACHLMLKRRHAAYRTGCIDGQ